MPAEASAGQVYYSQQDRLVALDSPGERSCPVCSAAGDPVISSGHQVIAYHPDGQQVWSAELEEPTKGAPVAGPGGLLYVQSERDHPL